MTLRIASAAGFLIIATLAGSAQVPKSATIKMMAGEVVQGIIAGQVAFDVGFGTGGGLVAGADIEAISEKGLQITAGADILQTILPLLNRYTMMKKPPHVQILLNAASKRPKEAGMLGVSFEAPCKLFDDATCENTNIDVNLISGTTKGSSPLAVERVLGEFRVEAGVATIIPTLSVTGAGGQVTKVDVTRIVPFDKAGK